MKNMKKLVALFAATVMTMSLSVSAFAAEVKSEGTVADGEFTLVFTPAADGSDDKIDQLTMIAYLVDAATVKEPKDIPAYDSQDIVAIDQVNGEDGFGEVPVNIEKLTTGYAIAVVMGNSNGTVSKALITYNKEENTVEVYTVTFMGANGSIYEEKTEVAKDTVIKLIVPATDPTKANSGVKKYAFIGWYTDSALNAKVADATVTGNITLYPKFSQVGIYGDATGDGQVNMLDLMQVKLKVTNTSYTGNAGKEIPDCETSTGKTGVYGDATGDGQVNMLDLMQVKLKVTNTSYTGNAGKDMVMVKD